MARSDQSGRNKQPGSGRGKRRVVESGAKRPRRSKTGSPQNRNSESRVSETSGEQVDRLQKIIARCGLASRRQAEELIRQGRVTVNGQCATLGERASLERDAIKVDGKLLRPLEAQVTLAMNKPAGVVTSTYDPEGRQTVIDLVPPRYRRALVPIGRLDYGTEGLLLLTTDGDVAQRVAHPRHGCHKVYEVKVRGTPDERSLERIRRGMNLDGYRLRPVRVSPARKRPSAGRDRQTNTWWLVELAEGRSRQIREMFKRVGHPVQRLRRLRVGTVELGALKPGEVRRLDDSEISGLTRSLARSRSRSS